MRRVFLVVLALLAAFWLVNAAVAVVGAHWSVAFGSVVLAGLTLALVRWLRR